MPDTSRYDGPDVERDEDADGRRNGRLPSDSVQNAGGVAQNTHDTPWGLEHCGVHLHVTHPVAAARRPTMPGQLRHLLREAHLRFRIFRIEPLNFDGAEGRVVSRGPGPKANRFGDRAWLRPVEVKIHGVVADLLGKTHIRP